MAFKKHNHEQELPMADVPVAQEPEEGPAVASDTHIRWGDQKLLTAQLPDHAKVYLMQQGAIKVRSDIAGGLPKAHRAAGKTKEESDAIIEALYVKRLEAILAGTAVTRAIGPRLIGLDRMLRVVARERVIDKAARLGKEAPKGKAMLDIIEMLIKADPKVRQIAELRMDDDGDEDFPTAA